MAELRQITIRIEADYIERAREIAAREGTKQSDVLRAAIKKGMTPAATDDEEAARIEETESQAALVEALEAQIVYLRSQLETKDKQIETQQTIALQAQQLHAAQIAPPVASVHHLEENNKKQDRPGGFWGRIFKH